MGDRLWVGKSSRYVTSHPGQLSLAIPPWVGAMSSSLVWLIWAVVCLHAAPLVQLFASVDNGWPHNALRYHQLMSASCHFRDCKAQQVLSLTRVSSTIASTRPLPLPFNRGLPGKWSLTVSVFVCQRAN